MRSTRAKRKLVPQKLLAEIVELTTLGVPLTHSIKRVLGEADVSRPVIAKLVKYYNMDNEEVRMSIFPPWLNETEPVQENPDDWYYKGFFPFGRWVRDI